MAVDRRVMLPITSKKYKQSTQAEQEDYTKALKKACAAHLSEGSPDTELIKRAFLPLRLFPPAPNLPHFHRLLAIAYRENHSSIGAETALAHGARVRSDAHEAAAGGERVHADRVGIWRHGWLGYVR
jgi:hypothetical protein